MIRSIRIAGRPYTEGEVLRAMYSPGVNPLLGIAAHITGAINGRDFSKGARVLSAAYRMAAEKVSGAIEKGELGATTRYLTNPITISSGKTLAQNLKAGIVGAAAATLMIW